MPLVLISRQLSKRKILQSCDYLQQQQQQQQHEKRRMLVIVASGTHTEKADD